VSLDQIKSELAQLRKSLGELDSLLQETEPVPFFAKMKTFHERAETEVNLVEQLLPKLDDAIKDLANFFGEDPNKINVLDLLNLVNDFTESFFVRFLKNLCAWCERFILIIIITIIHV